jgi:F0F1-type ATP synthase assembly protein I
VRTGAKLSNTGRHQQLVMELIVIQAIGVLVIAAIWLVQGLFSAISALFGGFIALIVNSGYAWRLFRKLDEKSIGQLMLTLYGGEVLKIIAAAVAAVFVMKIFILAPLPLLTGLAGTYIIYAPVAIYKQLKMVKV